MARLSIEVTPKEHKQIKIMAAMQGMSIRDYILKNSLPSVAKKQPMTEDKAMEALEALIGERLAEAKKGKISKYTIDDILNDIRKDL